LLHVRDLKRIGFGPISLDLDDGECVAVQGPSGAGKSLLLRAIADLDPSDGEVSLDGVRREAVPAPRWRRLVTYLSPEAGWWSDTVGAHFGDRQRADPLVVALGLPPDCHR
jgi:putative ABC transport system ATP-binding protein